jgi:hypothetical protein
MPTDDPQLMILREELSGLLDRVKRLFKPAAKPRVTLVIHNTGSENGNVVIGDDDLNDAIACIQKELDRR